MKYLAGLDIGTSGAKCVIIDQNGNVLSSVTKSYPVYTPRAAWSEQEPHDWFVASCNGLLEASTAMILYRLDSPGRCMALCHSEATTTF